VIAPDDKDWTWILHRPCAECGYDSAAVDPPGIPEWTLAVTGAWRDVLVGWPAGRLAARPSPERWCPLEYGCHVRDVCRTMDGRLAMMLAEDDPSFANWDQDATAIEDAYHRQDPVVVAGQLEVAAAGIAGRFGTVAGAQWERPGRRSDGARFTVATLGRYFVHDPYHHLVDIGVTPPRW
jgi:hypothetical protein